MDPYGRGTSDYRYDGGRVPRSYDSYPPPVEYPRSAPRVYAAVPAAVSYPAPTSNRRVEIHYYNPDEGIPFQVPIRPTPATVVAAAPPMQVQYPSLPSGSRSQFVPGDLYRVTGVEETQLYQPAPAPPVPRSAYLSYDFGYAPSVPQGVPQRRPPYGQYY